MANITETLRIIIDADSKGAERAFGKIGDDATKHVGKAETRVQKLSSKATSAGIAMATAGAVGAAGFYKLAKSSEEAEAQNRKLTNSVANSKKEFSGSGQKLRDLAASLQKKTAADADAIVSGQALLVQYGLSESQILKLTPLVVDLSRKMGVDLDTASKAVAKAVNGNTGALGKMGVQVDKTKAKIDPFAATLEGIRGAAGGFAEKEGKTFTGQIEILKNNLGDLGETVGKGAAGVFSDLAGGAISLIGGLNSLNPKIGESVGKIGTIGSLSITAVGGLAFMAGQFAKVKDLAIDAAGGLTKFGKAAAGIGTAFAFYAIIEAIGQIGNAIGDLPQKTEDSFNRVKKAIKSGTSGDILESFAQNVKATQDEFTGISDIIASVGKEVKLGTVGIGLDIENVDNAFQALLDGAGPAAAQTLVDAINKQRAALKPTSQEYKDLTEVAGRFQKTIGSIITTTKDQTIAQRGLSEQVTAAVDAYDQQEVTFEGLTKSLKTLESEIKLLSAAYELADANAAGFGKSIEQSTRLDDSVSSVNDLRSGLVDLGKGIKGLPKSVDTALNPFAKIGDQGQEALGNLLSFGQKSIGYLKQLIAQGAGSIVPGVAGKLREQLVKALKDAGIKDPKEIEKYLGLAGLATFQIDAALKVGNVEAELAKIRTSLSLFENELKAAPKEIRVGINKAILAGDIAVANRLIDYASRPRDASVRVKVVLPNSGTLGGALFPGLVLEDPPPRRRRAKGGPVTKSTPYTVNERGPEMFVPNSSGFVMNNSDSQRLVAGVEQMLSNGGGTVTAPQVVYNVNVAAGISDPAETGRRVVDAIRSYERTNGAGWRN